MFPAASRQIRNLLGFDYLAVTESELPSYQDGTEVVAKIRECCAAQQGGVASGVALSKGRDRLALSLRRVQFRTRPRESSRRAALNLCRRLPPAIG